MPLNLSYHWDKVTPVSQENTSLYILAIYSQSLNLCNSINSLVVKLRRYLFLKGKVVQNSRLGIKTKQHQIRGVSFDVESLWLAHSEFLNHEYETN